MITLRRRAALLAASLLLTGCGGGAAATPEHRPAAVAATDTPAASGTPAPTVSVEAAPRRIPGLGTRTWAAVPQDAAQVVVVTGRGRDSPLSTVVLYRRTRRAGRRGRTGPRTTRCAAGATTT